MSAEPKNTVVASRVIAPGLMRFSVSESTVATEQLLQRSSCRAWLSFFWEA